LQYFVANLFETQCTNFYQNWPSFIEDTTKTFWLTYLLDTFCLPVSTNDEQNFIQIYSTIMKYKM